MKTVWSTIVIVLLIGIVSGVVIANKANEGEGICITISPKMLVLSKDGGEVTVHSNIAFASVDWVQLEGIDPYLTKADTCGHLVAKFYADDVKDLDIVEPGQVTLILTGELVDEDGYVIAFSALDIIRVKD